MDHESQIRLRRNLNAATDEALTALANKGLMRRATRDLGSTPELSIEVTNDAIIVRGDGWTVTMPPEGPSAATDDSSASGVTRYVLTAAIYLRDNWFPEVNEGAADDSTEEVTESSGPTLAIENAREVLLNASAEELARWSGKTPLLEAIAADPSSSVVNPTPRLSVEFPDNSVTVLLMTDRPAKTLKRLLDQFKTTAPKSDQAKWILRAVLAIRHHAGKSPLTASVAQGEMTEAVREDRQRVATQVRRLATAIAATGLAHPSSAMLQKLQTMSVAAEAAKFPRLGRLLNSLADDVELFLNRHAGADRDRIADRLAIVFAISEAALQQTSEETDVSVFGRQRTRYTPIGDVTLSGVGAYRWQTASGFRGLTTLFWESTAQRFVSASVARGQEQDPQFDPEQAYHRSLDWSNSSSPERLCRSRFQLRSASINEDGRLSLSEKCQVENVESFEPTAADFGALRMADFSPLAEVAMKAVPLGLHLPHPLANLVVVRPTEWGKKWFDELQQALVWELFDETGNMIPLIVSWNDVNERTVDFVEAAEVKRDKLIDVLAFVELQEGRLRLRPVSFFSGGGIKGDHLFCPQFDQERITSRHISLIERLRKKFKRTKRIDTSVGTPEESLEADIATAIAACPQTLQNLLLQLSELVTARLESGIRKLTDADRDRFKAHRSHAKGLGLDLLSDSLEQIVDGSDHAAVLLLRIAYRLKLARQSLAVPPVQ